MLRAKTMKTPAEIIQAVKTEGRKALFEHEAKELARAVGISVPRFEVVGADGKKSMLAAAEKLKYPLALKAVSPDILHKTEAGAVATDLRNRDEVRAAGDRLTRLGHIPLLIQEHVGAGIELLIGGRQDPVFGPLVAVGIGGFLAEAVRDLSTALAPLSLEEARTLVGQGPRARLLAGYRGLPGGGSEAAARALVAVGALLAEQPRVAELDVNPLIIRGEQAIAVDALVIVGGDGASGGICRARLNLT